MNERTVRAVRERAGFRCEYCRLPDSVVHTTFETEHVVPEFHGGGSTMGNLAYSCLRCNRRKGPNLSGMDWDRSKTEPVKLFNPRRHRWGYHFRTDGPRVMGRTAIGRVTIFVLDMNETTRVNFRRALVEEGLWPGTV